MSLRARLLAAATLAVVAVLASASAAGAAAAIHIVNQDAAGEGLNDPTAVAPVGGNTGTTLGGQRLQALQYAAGLWGARLTSPVATDVDVQFNPMTCGATMAWISWWDRNFANVPHSSVWYPEALANKIAGSDLCVAPDCGTGAEFDMATNSSVDDGSCPGDPAWYYGLDGNPPTDERDFVTYALIVIAKNLGMESTIDLTTGALMGAGYDYDYDILALQLANVGAGGKLSTIPDWDNPDRLAMVKNPGRLHWMGSGAPVSYLLAAAAGELTAGLGPWGTVEMYSPDPPVPGISVSMFGSTLSPDQLLEALPSGGLVGVARHDFGLADDALADLGWAICGNGVVEMDEECDGTGTECGPGWCSDCRLIGDPVCGDGTLTTRCGERCDDGNGVAGDGCDASCQMEPAALTCQESIYKAGRVYFKKSLKALTRCRNAINRDKLFIAPEDCPTHESVAPKLLQAGSRQHKALAKRCTDGVVASLNACASTIDGLIAVAGDTGCIINGAREATDRLVTAAYGRVLDPSEETVDTCQRSIAKQTTNFEFAQIDFRYDCRQTQNEGGVYDPCVADIHAATLWGAYVKFGGISEDCYIPTVQSLAPCGGVPLTASGLTGEAGCLMNLTSQVADDLIADWTGQ